jgi:hypothetical protein
MLNVQKEKYWKEEESLTHRSIRRFTVDSVFVFLSTSKTSLSSNPCA